MSPALASHLSSAQVAAPSNIGSLPTFSNWSNPLPDSVRDLDGRKHYLQANNNRFLEMHPNGTRGVRHKTEYCLLTILIFNVTVSSHMTWDQDNKERGRNPVGRSRHIIQGVNTKDYLCMDNKSVVYQTPTFTEGHCVFTHELTTKHRARYYKQLNSTSPKWYLGINKDGSIRCGNVTRKKQDGANFNTIVYGDNNKDTSVSPPFTPTRRKCCTTNKCKTKRDPNKKDRKPPRDKKCKPRYKNWCRKHRRQFFKLKLKELKRYYNRCIKKERIRHCKDS